jgi:glutaryl-CoA dehydrogenase
MSGSAAFQLVQDLLVRMLANITASACMCARLAQLQASGAAADEHSALAKAFCKVRMRETVGYARELLGGSGIRSSTSSDALSQTPRRSTPMRAHGKSTLSWSAAITGHGAFV